MQRPAHIFISPHRDDACFSLAATISLLGGGHLINIFSKSQYTSQPSLAAQTPSLSAEVVTAIRDKEDSEFCEMTNLVRHELEFEDADLLGLTWNFDDNQTSIQAATEKAQLISAQLTPLLQQLIIDSGAGTATLYGPMAIGGHRDHIATLMSIQMIKSTPWGQAQRWVFYEDLPYASWPGEREKSLPRFEAIIQESTLSKHILALGPERLAAKMKLVNIYASQHPSPPLIKDFICNDSWITGPHEALWVGGVD